MENRSDIQSNGPPHDRFFLGASLPTQVFRDAQNLGFPVYRQRDPHRLRPMMHPQWVGRFKNQSVVGLVVEDLATGERTVEPLPALSIESGDRAERLRAWLDHLGGGWREPLYICARVVAFAGDTRGWGLWCDQDREITVLGIPEEELGEIREWAGEVVDWAWYDATEVEELLRPSYYPEPVPEEVTRTIRSNFAVARLRDRTASDGSIQITSRVPAPVAALPPRNSRQERESDSGAGRSHRVRDPPGR